MKGLKIVGASLSNVIVKGSSSVGQVVEIIDKGATYVNNELDDILEDQRILSDIKNDFREVVRNESKEARATGNKEALRAAYKQTREDLEGFAD